MKNIFIFFYLLFSLNLFSQPVIVWQKTIGGNNADELFVIRQTIDGGYVLGGYSNSNISGDKTENNRGGDDYWIVKIDSSGNIQWEKTIGGSGYDDLFSMEQTTDSGYILGGRSDSNISGDKTENSRGLTDYWILKLDALGNIQWQKTIGGNDDDGLTSIKQTFDGGYILNGGSATQLASGDKNLDSSGVWILKLDSIGNIHWQRVFTKKGASSIIQTIDSGYFMGGYSQIRSGDYWVTKINSAGSIQWEKSIGGNDLDEFKSIQLTTDGGYIIGGSSFSNISGDKTENKRGFEDFWIVKLGSSGNIQWQKTIGGINHDYFYSIEQSPDGGYITGGFSSSNISGDKTDNSKGFEDYWLVKLDASGNILWQKTIGGNGDDELRSLQITADGGFILAGSSLSDISGDKTENSWGASDYWILKYSKDDTGIEEVNPQFLLQVYPNPVTSYLTISLSNLKKYTLNIINPEGKICFQTTSFATRLQLDVQNLSAGIYLCNLKLGNESYFEKMIVVK